MDIAGYENKGQITGTFATTLSGDFLTDANSLHERDRVMSSTNGFDIYHSPKHWANEETVVRLVKIIIPYVEATRHTFK